MRPMRSSLGQTARPKFMALSRSILFPPIKSAQPPEGEGKRCHIPRFNTLPANDECRTLGAKRFDIPQNFGPLMSIKSAERAEKETHMRFPSQPSSAAGLD